MQYSNLFMRAMLYLYLIFMPACVTNESKKELNSSSLIDSTMMSIDTNYNIMNTDTAVLTNTDNLTNDNFKSKKEMYKFIKDFSKRDFRESRNQVILDGDELQWKVSEIKSYGNLLKYKAELPDSLGIIEYTCHPDKGECTMTMIGDKDVATMYFNQAKLGMLNPQCNITEAGQQCESNKDWDDDYPLEIHFTISIPELYFRF